jgi:hypothetical protein
MSYKNEQIELAQALLDTPKVKLLEIISKLQVEVEALRKDAERYQWLRSQHWEKSELCVVEHPRASIRLGFDCPSLLRLDEIIDAAIAKNTQEQA